MITRPGCINYSDYYDEDFNIREGRVVERNGNLTYVEDSKTGKGEWLAPHELKHGQS